MPGSTPTSLADEWSLLRDYLAADAPQAARQQAFSRLAERYVDPVYAAARRQLGGDVHLAEDVTQAVFMVLAEKARSVPSDRPLSAWLLKVTGYCAANARRRRADRDKHERRAAEMARENRSAGASSGDDDIESLAPLLDEGLAALRAVDRDAILLKYFEKKSLREVGEALGISEDAAQKRVLRAVEKLRGFFRRRGAVATSAVAVATLLAAESAPAAPAGLATMVAATTATTAGTAAVASSAVATSATGAATSTTAATLAKGALVTMAMKKTVALSAAGLVLLAGVGGVALVVSSSGWGGGGGGRRTVAVAPQQGGTAGAAGAPNGTTTPTSAASPALSFADGITAQLVMMYELPGQSAGGRLRDALGFGGGAGIPKPIAWWGADGSILSPMSMQGMANVSAGSQAGRRQVGFIVAMRGANIDGANLAIRISGVSSSAMTSNRPNRGERNTLLVGSFGKDAERATVTLGVSNGTWTEEAVLPVSAEALATTKPSGPRIYGELGESKGMLTVEVSHDGIRPGRDGQMVAVVKGGRRVSMDSYEGHGGGGGTARFACARADVEKLLYLSRPFEWATIDNVALKPNATVAPATGPGGAGANGVGAGN